MSAAALTGSALFGRYPARDAAPIRWRAPDTRRGEARACCTVLRREGGCPADFAGAYRVVRIGFVGMRDFCAGRGVGL